jgi:hypothetical protein
MYNGQSCFSKSWNCLEIVHYATFKIRINTRHSVDTIGSHAYTKRAGNTHFSPIGKAIPKVWAIHVASTKYHTLQALIFFYVAQQPLLGQGLLIIAASRSYSDKLQSVTLFRTSNQPDATTSTRHHTTLTREIYSGTRPDSKFKSAILASERP